MTMRPADIKLTKKEFGEKGASNKKKKPANRTRYEFKHERSGSQGPGAGSIPRTASQHHISTMSNQMRPAI